MRTRSQTRHLQKELEYEIDFDEASRAWNSNKRRLANGCYQYICGSILSSGKYCQKYPTSGGYFCSVHNKK